MDSIVVVGASLAGLRVVENIRKKGYQGRLVLVGDETRTPYDRPPLSKEVLRGEWEPERIDLRPRQPAANIDHFEPAFGVCQTAASLPIQS